MEKTNLLAVAAVLAVKIKQKKHLNKIVRKKWVKDYLLKRPQTSPTHLLEELRLEPTGWFNYFKMNEEVYLELLKLVSKYIAKQDTHLRKSISAHERLSVTLRFLATGNNYSELKFHSRISAQSLSKIIPETCKAIYFVLRGEFMKFPASQAEWIEISQQFKKRWKFPNCLGAIDGKHVAIKAPQNSGSFFFNYKGYHSLVLLAIANANYEFIMCDFGVNGRISDGGVIEYSKFYDKLKSGALCIPKPTKVGSGNEELPFVFISDDTFSLRPDMIKPYSQAELTPEKSYFNKRLLKGCQTIESAFGIMRSRFGIFGTEINLKLENIDSVVMACCVLHNFLRKKCSNTYSPDLDTEEIKEENFVNNNLQCGPSKNPSLEAKAVRDKFLRYFNHEEDGEDL